MITYNYYLPADCYAHSLEVSYLNTSVVFRSFKSGNNVHAEDDPGHDRIRAWGGQI